MAFKAENITLRSKSIFHDDAIFVKQLWHLFTDVQVHTKMIIKPMELLLISLKFTNILYKTIIPLNMYFD